MLKILKVTGNSLFPLYQEGDFVLVFKIPFEFFKYVNYQVGDIVVINHPYYGTIIKKIKQVSDDNNQFFVIGTQMNSTDSRQFGMVEKKWIMGKVILHFKKPGKGIDLM